MNRTTAAVLLFAASIPALAAPWAPTPSCDIATAQALYSLTLPGDGNAMPLEATSLAAALAERSASLPPLANVSPRQLLAAFAMKLRDIRYRRGGRAPKTGFDCSGFVQYVYAQTLGVDLPDDSASQYLDGARVARSELQTGDLVFFHTRGKQVSHVGIYLDNGRFIHSPSTGKRVRVDELSDRYWAQRFVGAKRPRALAENASQV